jgi:hypothetical protein
VETIEPGGDDRDRTDDPLLAKQVLSQLSYAPNLGTPCLDRSGSSDPASPASNTKRPAALRPPTRIGGPGRI